MRKLIGYSALIIGIIDLFTLMFLMFSGNVVTYGGFTTIGAFCFVLWFVCVFTVVFCLIIPFIKKMLGNGFSSQSFVQNGYSGRCSQCGKGYQGSVDFCPHCGAKQ